jgi:hypothetical protein
MFQTIPLSVIRSSTVHTAMVYVIQVCCVYSEKETPGDGQRNCLKHVEFNSKSKFEKLVHLVGFITRTELQIHSTWNTLIVESN